ncbi:CPBP family intramembrane glutamic endopeptidase [Rummeliibacillus sp. TYF005]|uniref:CPBP family intramembrane glutamic endopeptidase n=1 Tax=Rummeliibacillus sp. TYF005 TaxID=2058214 RepID=UPI001F14B0A2|nr:type II CAAX endopeptidase family protein [Rummeliibacillus sp. TYF005]
MKSQKTALYILLVYILMQLSGFFFIRPLFHFIQGRNPELSKNELILTTNGWYTFISMGIALIISILLVSRDSNFWKIYKGNKASLPISILWGIIGFFMVMIGQSIGAIIESNLGIKQGSENTASLLSITDVAPIIIIAIVFFGPVLEEFVFRRVIFGSLVQTTNFFVAALVSSIVFAIIHLDFPHIIIYAISGFIFAFLYHKTKRIITSIIAHMMLNGFITIVQFYREPINEFIKQLQQMQ